MITQKERRRLYAIATQKFHADVAPFWERYVKDAKKAANKARKNGRKPNADVAPFWKQYRKASTKVRNKYLQRTKEIDNM